VPGALTAEFHVSASAVGLGAGEFTPAAQRAVAVQLTRPERQGRAVALVFVGLTIATTWGAAGQTTVVDSTTSTRGSFATVKRSRNGTGLDGEPRAA
jgi:predicted MFS family arabinose efflux permease